MNRGACALVPFRSLDNGKHRLGKVMTPLLRRDFIAAMLADTLAALKATEGIEQLFLLSNDPQAAVIGRAHGAVCLAEAPAANDLNSAVQFAAFDLSSQYRSLMVVHGDLPLLLSAELGRFLAAHNELLAEAESPGTQSTAAGESAVAIKSAAAISIVPDRHQSGSNCILCSPMQRMRFYYGEGSLAKHLAFADLEGIQSQTVQLESAGLDIDEPDDLQELRNHDRLPTASHVAGFLTKHDRIN